METLNEKLPDPKEEALDEKKAAILEACKLRDLAALTALAESSGGFLTDAIRQEAWPILLGLPPDKSEDNPEDSWKSLPPHKDEDQVQLDVNRAFVYYPNHNNESLLDRQKAQLSTLIVSTLRHHPNLSYFQGYHDISQVLLLVLPSSTRYPALSHLSLLRIRDFMLPSLSPAISQLRLLPDILRLSDPALWQHLSSTEPFFALSGTLTMYAHDITTLGEITRLFDVLLSKEPVFTIYLFAAIVRSRREELLDIPFDEPEMLHSVLSKLPKPLDLEGLIRDAGGLMKEFPPEKLPQWKRISRWSVLKTGRTGVKWKLEEGEEFFEKQIKELEWKEKREKALKLLWAYRRPVKTVGFAVVVGVLAILLRRYSSGGTHGHQFLSERGGPLGYATELLGRWWLR
ncbi:rab-GTPase-TBC domain-containing protein [Podospora fimiseda]|uniref:Rab-GTPase-TBC domain-containing protein n=1 Tax=Podospora fimiseda TaxID=252190 RepID=A0AAN7H7M5_9PEZI|nr:rab-GTPase-TBC domain-containing protein [Podospora fimiseda]